MSLWLHGIKNNYYRDGFEVLSHPSKSLKLDPVAALKCYIDKTSTRRLANKAVFLALTSSYNTIGANKIGKILDKLIELADLGGQGYTAKCFCPTGTTNAVEQGVKPDTIQKIGR